MFYLNEGFHHILDPRGYDHILFVVALCVSYSIKEWKNVAWLVTAFTLGHSLTLALATLKILTFRTDIIEFLIPLTILATCLLNFFQAKKNTKISWQRYGLALGFGWIHGLGFSNFLRSMLGREESIFLPLLTFNLGLEIGQLLIVATILCISGLLTQVFKTNRRDWMVAVSGIVFGVSLTILQKNWIF
jgi:hydrogenase/urease accessory protein HupE